MSHPPGPWGTSPPCDIVRIAVVSRGGVVASVSGDMAIAQANAALIAAAPDLLAALQSVLVEVTPDQRPYSTDSYLPQHVVDAVRAAIDRAEGVRERA